MFWYDGCLGEWLFFDLFFVNGVCGMSLFSDGMVIYLLIGIILGEGRLLKMWKIVFFDEELELVVFFNFSSESFMVVVGEGSVLVFDVFGRLVNVGMIFDFYYVCWGLVVGIYVVFFISKWMGKWLVRKVVVVD